MVGGSWEREDVRAKTAVYDDLRNLSCPLSLGGDRLTGRAVGLGKATCWTV